MSPRLSGISTYGLHGLGKGDEHPAQAPFGVLYGTFTFTFTFTATKPGVAPIRQHRTRWTSTSG